MLRYYNPHLETMSRDDLESLQFAKLKRLLEKLRATNRFFRQRFDAHGVNLEKIRDLQDFSRLVPTMDKASIMEDQNENPPFGYRLSLPISRVAQLVTTSGTSGLGQEMHPRSAADMEMVGALWVPHLYWTGLGPGDTALNTVPIGMLNAGWSISLAFFKLGVVPIHAFGQGAKATVETIRRFKANWIWITPVFLTRLTVICQEMGIDPKREMGHIKSICVATEAFPIDWALRMQEFWGADLHEMYGTTQGGSLVAGSCERGAVPDGQRGCLHLAEANYVVEVVDPNTGKSVGDEGEGEAVLTSLDIEASAIVRFRTRDKVLLYPHNKCSCGRPFAIWESGSIGRYDDMLKIKATNIWPSAVDSIIFSYPELEEYAARVFVDAGGREEVEIRLALKKASIASLSEAEKAALLGKVSGQIRERVGVGMSLRWVAREELPTFEFKARRWTDERMKNLSGNF